MLSSEPVFPSPDAFSSVLVIGTQPNSTYDFYIIPRLGVTARKKLIYHDPRKEKLDDETFNPDDCLVIINRYVTGNVVGWIKRHRTRLGAVIWLLDDDLNAMVTSKSVPLLNRALPTRTLFHQKALKPLVDHMIVSTYRLAAIYADWPVVVAPPVIDLQTGQKLLDPSRLYYFAKMHGPEHAFLYPVIKNILEKHRQVRFTVTANGHWQRQWQKLERVHVIPEMSYAEFTYYLDTLPHAGLYLVPLTTSRLNASRSYAKLLDVAKSGSAGLVADHRAYRRFLADPYIQTAGIKGLDTSMQSWQNAIETLLRNHEQAEANRQAIATFVRQTYHARQMIV